MMASLSPTAGVVGLALISSTIAMAACWVLMEGRLAAERSKCGMKGDEGHRASAPAENTREASKAIRAGQN
jgi:hypothetical protein